jgi:hypothetical protein
MLINFHKPNSQNKQSQMTNYPNNQSPLERKVKRNHIESQMGDVSMKKTEDINLICSPARTLPI